MPKLKVEDLAKIKEKTRKTTVLREGAGKAKVTVHMGTCGIASGAKPIMDALLKGMKNKDVKDVILTTSGCAGLCSQEPMATVELKGAPPVIYVDLTPEKIGVIFNKHVLEGDVVQEYALAVGSERMF
jgi:NADP-reducing hydrogenase subunit HndB